MVLLLYQACYWLLTCQAIFLYGFGKNEKQNIDKAELQYFKKLGNDLLALDSEELEESIGQKILFDLEEEE